MTNLLDKLSLSISTNFPEAAVIAKERLLSIKIAHRTMNIRFNKKLSEIFYINLVDTDIRELEQARFFDEDLNLNDSRTIEKINNIADNFFVNGFNVVEYHAIGLMMKKEFKFESVNRTLIVYCKAPWWLLISWLFIVGLFFMMIINVLEYLKLIGEKRDFFYGGVIK